MEHLQKQNAGGSVAKRYPVLLGAVKGTQNFCSKTSTKMQIVTKNRTSEKKTLILHIDVYTTNHLTCYTRAISERF